MWCCLYVENLFILIGSTLLHFITIIIINMMLYMLLYYGNGFKSDLGKLHIGFVRYSGASFTYTFR